MKRTAALGAILVVLAWATGTLAARPLDTEDAGTLDPGNSEVELGGDYVRNAADALWILKGTLSAGILPRLEVRFELPVALIDPDGPGSSFAGVADALVGAKYRFVDERRTLPALMAAVALRLPTGDPDRGREEFNVTPLGVEGVDVTRVGIVGKALGPVILHGNAAYTFVTGDREADVATLAVSAEYRVTNALSLVAEVMGFLFVHDAELDTGRVRGGVSYAIRDGIKVDAAVGRGLGHDSPRLLLTVGVTFAF
jgi:hypothetical protein